MKKLRLQKKFDSNTIEIREVEGVHCRAIVNYGRVMHSQSTLGTQIESTDHRIYIYPEKCFQHLCQGYAFKGCLSNLACRGIKLGPFQTVEDAYIKLKEIRLQFQDFLNNLDSHFN